MLEADIYVGTNSYSRVTAHDHCEETTRPRSHRNVRSRKPSRLSTSHSGPNRSDLPKSTAGGRSSGPTTSPLSPGSISAGLRGDDPEADDDACVVRGAWADGRGDAQTETLASIAPSDPRTRVFFASRSEWRTSERTPKFLRSPLFLFCLLELQPPIFPGLVVLSAPAEGEEGDRGKGGRSGPARGSRPTFSALLA